MSSTPSDAKNIDAATSPWPRHTHGYEWLGPEACSVMTKTGRRCDHGHQWQARYANLQQGYGCPRCTTAGRPAGGRWGGRLSSLCN